MSNFIWCSNKADIYNYMYIEPTVFSVCIINWGTLGLPIFICLLVYFFLTFGLFFSVPAQLYFWTLIVLLTVTPIFPNPALAFCCLLGFLKIICPSHSMWQSWLIKEESENKLSLRKQTSSDLRWLSIVSFQLIEIQRKLHTREIWTVSMLSTMCFYSLLLKSQILANDFSSEHI